MEENLKNYHFTDAELIMESVRIYTCINRDVNDFRTWKLSPGCLVDFEDQIIKFSGFPTDEEMQDDINIVVENKNGISDLIQRKLVSIEHTAKQLWGNTGKFTSFGFSPVDDLTDDEILLLVRRVVRVSHRFLDEIRMKGVTEDDLNQLTELGHHFFNMMSLQKEMIVDKANKRRERMALGNEVYTSLVRLAEAGKAVFEHSNEARYNDYILYHEKGSGALSQTA